MEKIIFYIIAGFLAIMIFRSPNEKKLYWVFISLLLFPRTIVFSKTPFICFPVFILSVLYLDFLIHFKKTYKSFKQFPLRVPLLIFFFCLFLVSFFDTKLDFYLVLYKPFYFLLENFWPAFFAYCCIKTLKGVERTLDVVLSLLFICSVFGICNKIMDVNVYTAYISKIFDTIDFGNYYTTVKDTRFRISSFTWNPMYYGIVVALGILISIFYLTAFKLKRPKMIFCVVTLILLVINLFLVNSRAPVISLLAGLGVYYLFGLELNNRLIVMAILCAGFVVFTITFPGKFQLLTSSFRSLSSGETDVKGSSLSMRVMQLKNSLRVFSTSPISGKGFDYIEKELGYTGQFGQNNHVARHFGGFESYAFKLLIEQGLMGIIANLVFFSALFAYLFNMKERLNPIGKKYVFFTISLLVCFLLFIFSSGDLYSFSFFMLLLGINIGAINLCLKDVEEEKELPQKNSVFRRYGFQV